MSFHQHVLSNGLQIIGETNPAALCTAVAFWVQPARAMKLLMFPVYRIFSNTWSSKEPSAGMPLPSTAILPGSVPTIMPSPAKKTPFFTPLFCRSFFRKRSMFLPTSCGRVCGSKISQPKRK